MEHTTELKSALNELRRLTGITVNVAEDTPEEIERTITQIRYLCTAYREKYNKNHFLKSLMTDNISTMEVADRAQRLHIEQEERRILFLLETKGSLDDTVTEILKHLFPSQAKSYLVPMTDNSLAILRPLRDKESEQNFSQIAHSIVATLNTEALTFVQIAYSGVINHLTELADAYRETSLALRVGKLFYSEQTIFPYNHLGIGRLIYQLPIPVCEDFLAEIFGNRIPDSIEEETMTTINRFLQNNLNIAETARQLHMHRNTLIYRLEQAEKRTGLDLRKFEDAMIFKVASMVINYLHTERTS